MSESFIGEIKMLGFNFPPKGWHFCQGKLLPIDQNQALYSLLGTTYGGDGRSTFALPDLRGRMPIGEGTGSGLTSRARGQAEGGEQVTLNGTQVPIMAHSHPATFTPGDAALVQIEIPATSASNATTETPGATTILGKGNVDLSSLREGVKPTNLYSTAAENTTLKPFSVPIPASTGTVDVKENTATEASKTVNVMNPFLVLNFSIALQGEYPSRN